MSGHHSATAQTHTWLTPPHIIEALGPFDLDPCAAPDPRPWPTAVEHWTELGLMREWFGRVWCNPPYGPFAGDWLKQCADHGNAIALVFARTETASFFRNVWERADGILFLRGRLTFLRPDGSKPRGDGSGNSGAPSVLVAYGANNVDRLRECGIDGKLIELRAEQ